ncbi:hypothetical protein [Botrimarina hoheduenensis]|uniref:Uncharacterized protein n=1 Tax=Botrimarina hoheduenensis TaxID=2528000 RepID=A0A5C5VY94_9BACT|nr:hypothetical protein [Botrimarina hoheduenensis]TWT42711.1 hypothetical protein Pla111_26840 [Botrimarina hoheduenensis]
MSVASACLLVFLAGVNYGWEPVRSDAVTATSTKHDYIVQLSGEDLRSIARGDTTELTSVVPAEVGPIDSVRVRFGEGPLPQGIAGHPESHLQTVAKPVIDEASGDSVPWPEPKRQTVYQNPSQFNVQGLQQGFGQATPQQGPLREFGNNLSEATRQSLSDLGQGTQGFFEGIANGVQSSAESLGNVGRNTINAGNPDYFRQRQAAEMAQRATPPPPSWDGTSANAPRSSLPPDPFDNNLPPQQNQSGYSYQYPNPSASGGTTSGNIAQSFAGEPTLTNGTFDRPSRLEAVSDPTYYGNNAQTPAANGYGPGYGPTNTPPGYNNQPQNPYPGQSYPSQQTAQQQNPALQYSGQQYPPTNNPAYYNDQNANPLARQNSGGSLFDNSRAGGPLLTPPSVIPTSASQATNWPAPQGNQNGGQNPDPANGNSWANMPPIGTAAATSATDGGSPANNQQTNANVPLETTDPLNRGLVYVLLIGSLALNFYVWTTYLDTRNKYRAALRRGPSSYANAAL